MLAFDRPVPGVHGAFYDQDKSTRVHVLPDRLVPFASSTGPEVSLLLHRTPSGQVGGVFQARLSLAVPDGALRAPNWTMAEVAAVRAKITPRAPGSPTHLGNWQPAILDGAGSVFFQFHLASTDAQLMRRLAFDGGIF